MPSKVHQISYNPEILQMRGVSIDDIKLYLDFLSKTLKKKFSEIAPLNFMDTGSLDRLLTLYEVLSKLETVKGFDRHAAEYNNKRFLATLFVSRVALYLLNKVDDLELEPITPPTAGNPDIKFTIGEQDVYIECKNIETSQFSDITEHRNIFEVLEAYMDFPHQIWLSYKTSPTVDELHSLGENIKKLANTVKITGNIINNKQYKVNVHLRNAYGDPNVAAVADMIMEDTGSKDRAPGHAFMEKGKTFLVDGPEIDYKKILKTKIKSAKGQYVKNHIFLTAINTDSMLGIMEENIQCIESLFQPKKNTRYSGVLLANHQCLTNDGKWTQIINPYAENLVTENITRIFS